MTSGFKDGVIDGLKNDLIGIVEMVSSPIETANQLGEVASMIWEIGREGNYGELFEALGEEAKNQYNQIMSIDDETKRDYELGLLAGAGIYLVASTVGVPEKLAAKFPGLASKVKGLVGVRGVDKIPWGSWADYEKVTIIINEEAQTYAKIGDRLYSKHAVDRMQPSGNKYGSYVTQAGGDYGRGVAPGYVEQVIRDTRPVLQENGNLSYTSGSLQIITNKDGAVITIITK